MRIPRRADALDAELYVDGLMAVVWLGILLSWQSAAWAASLFQVTVFVLGGALLIRQIASGDPIRLAPDTIALAALVGWGPVQIALGRSVEPYATWTSAVNWLALATIYWSAKTLLRDRPMRSRFLSTEIWVGSAIAIVSILLKFGSPQKVYGFFETRYPAIGPFIYKNHYAVFVELLLPIAFYKMTSGKHRRAPYVLLFAALFACSVASLSRAGLAIVMGESAVLLVISWISGRIALQEVRRIIIPMLLLIVAFILIVGWDAAWARFQEAHPFEHRSALARSTVDMIEARPLAGFGLGTWRTVYPQYANFDVARLANEAHDDWLQWAADGGVGFAAVILFFAVYVGRYAWKHVWGLGVPAVFVHCLGDYAMRNIPLAGLLFLIAGALAAAGETKPARTGGTDQARTDGTDPEWQILSLRMSPE